MRNFLASYSVNQARCERGSTVIVLMLVLLTVSVPLVMGATVMASQFSISSRVFGGILRDQYSASSGQEYAYYNILNDQAFVNSMTQGSPSVPLNITQNEQAVAVTVTKVWGTGGLEGQALAVSKEVAPSSAPVNVLTTFTYTITIKNEGTQSVQLRQVSDYLPPRFDYMSGSTTGLTTNNPATSNASLATCGDTPSRLLWDVSSQNIMIDPGVERTLTFNANGTLPDGTYYNQASARYTPWWGGGDVEIYSEFTSPVTVGAGSAICGYEMVLLLTKTVIPTTVEPGVNTVFTYTITAENIDVAAHNLCIIYDLLPPTFTYVIGSSNQPGNILTSDPSQIWQPTPERWQLRWGNTGVPPMLVLNGGEIRTQVFQAEAVPEAGANYLNEISFRWTDKLPAGKCQPGSGNGSNVQGGAGAGAAVDVAQFYDITSSAGGSTINARIEVFPGSGELNILSWQETR